MKTTSALFGAIVFAAVCAWADPAVIIRERAKELSNQNNVRQGVAPPTQSPQPTMAPNAPAAPTLSPGLMRFNTDLTTIKSEGVVTPDQQQKLTQELLVGAQRAKPALKTASKLAADIAAAFAEKPLSPTSRARLIQDLDAVLNPGKYPQAKPDGIIKDIQAIFQDNGLARIKAVAIATDAQNVAAEIQKGGG